MKFIARDAEENMLLPHLVRGSRLAVSSTGSHVTTPVNYTISGAIYRLWFEWALLVDSNIICHQ